MFRILVVDDEKSILEFFEIFLAQQGYEVEVLEDPTSVFERVKKNRYDLVITDLSMPQSDGLQVLSKVKEASPDTVVIIMTAYATAESAIEAMRNGAYDYIMKPFKVEDVRHTIANALEKVQLRLENRALRKKLGAEQKGISRFVGKSEKIRQVCDLIARVAPGKTSILLHGESGTGKELAARAIHELSNRSDKPFVSINCGAIPESLIESELFGYQKGAFTGADADKIGLFEAAQEGTIFLDEVSELPLHLQVKLLRVLQERVIRRVGATISIPIDVRVISASNKDLETEAQEGRFRDDLYYRLNVVRVEMPPLRDRMEDVPLLVAEFIRKTAAEQERKITGISAHAMEKIMRYPFPGNIRELENLIEQSVALEISPIIELSTLPEKIRLIGDRPATAPSVPSLSEGGVDLEALLSEYERLLILDALKLSRGVRKRAADLLNITFRSMRYRLTKHQIGQEDEVF